MPKDPFNNILQQAKLRNQNVFNYSHPKSVMNPLVSAPLW